MTMTTAPEPDLHKGWTESLLRRALVLASPGAQSILVYIAQHPRCTTRQIALALGFKGERSVPAYLRWFSRDVDELNVRDRDGKFRWPLDFPGKRGNYDLYDMKPAVRAVVLDVLGER